MESATWEIWGKLFLEKSKALGTQIYEGVKEGASFVADKTVEGATFVAEKTKEGASYVAEKTKPATDKIKEGASYLGDQIVNTYVDVKAKITGEEQKPNEQPVEGDNNNQPQEKKEENSEASKGTDTTSEEHS